MIRPGLCSVTFRDLSPQQVVDHAARAGLVGIEWGGDVHVPPGDTKTAEQVRDLTEQAGLAVASYGSYLRFDGEDRAHQVEADSVLAVARALQAPRVRVWAGSAGSRETPAEERERITERIRAFAAQAGRSGIEVGLEFHGNTLTDEVGSTLRLLEETDRDGAEPEEGRVRTYWQPPQDMPDESALETLRAVLPRTSSIHVFSWWPGSTRLPLAERSELWRRAFDILRAEGSPRDALLEFVPGDDPALLAREAATLRDLLDTAPG
ncbi:sugar phosphate isomerase [Brachybacterium endophyticum]|uniref:Sugar phosphate isomerase n=1 Tax=Brachybacterium endophyticum TaxID=2182385 RepID=A0A2U2RK80_9MICO|nr:TIM barrel protein [Brachybacterium endophyticum]PWH06277.1 sugar phosphate isomerase [Brachybacterium endophyticum]